MSVFECFAENLGYSRKNISMYASVHIFQHIYHKTALFPTAQHLPCNSDFDK